MKETLSNQEDIGFLFNVDILIKSRSNALALQSLLEFINNEEQIADFRIQSGIELGKIIEATLQSKKDSFVTLHNERKKSQRSTEGVHCSSDTCLTCSSQNTESTRTTG